MSSVLFFLFTKWAFFIFFFFLQVEDEADEISKTEFEKLEAKLGETDSPVETDSSNTTKSV